ncbi:MAG: metallophosphoesterase [Bacteroidia bacterium]|nr:metallophosphoesterase [Bacteroidia bacterium]
MIDFIGDIHGHAEKLKALLKKLGYVFKNGSYTHPERKVLFVGDYIDRGPQIRETLEIVKAMVDSGNGIALMGNHEYNALCFHVTETEGGHLRKHSIKNIIQHYKTLLQFQNKQAEYEAYLEWVKTLPLFYETENFRAVHACWDDGYIAYLQTALHKNCLTDELIYQSVKLGTPLNQAIDNTLKGKEIAMPEGMFFTDSDGNKRKEIRIKWWEDPGKTTYKNISVEMHADLPESVVNVELMQSANFYAAQNKPVFFGHYWLKGNPLLYRNNICCLDYSVAKNGNLVAYRFDDEEKLSNSKLVFV